jgi:hypothetical protein
MERQGMMASRIAVWLRTVPVSAWLFALDLAMGAEIFFHFYPGAMSDDSFAILSQARSGVLSDGHPPLLALVWGVMDRWIPGPAGLLFLNLFLFYGGLFLTFLWASREGHGKPLAPMLVVGFYPPVTAILGVIWIDITMAALFMASLGVFLTGCGCKKGWHRVLLTVAALFLAANGLAMRHNGAAAALPLLIYFFFALAEVRQGKIKKLFISTLVGVSLCLVLIVTWSALYAQLTEVKRNLWRQIVLYDIAGISFHEGKNLFADGLLRSGGFEDIRVLYTPRSYIPLVLGEQVHALPGDAVVAAHKLELNADDPALNKKLASNWISAIEEHPFSYLKHRFNFFVSLTTRSPWGLWTTLYERIPPNDFGVPERKRAEGSIYFSFVRLLSRGGFFFVPIYYICFSLIMLFPTWVSASRRGSSLCYLAFFLYLSGLFHMGALFFVAASSDSRYSHWMILATVLATALLWVEHRKTPFGLIESLKNRFLRGAVKT